MQSRKLLQSKQDELAQEVVKALQYGKVVACPTDTIYGLLADATNTRAVRKIFQIKRREQGKALPVFVGSIAMAKRLAYVSKKQEAFLKKHWPGKVTVVLKSREVLPKALEMNGTIALRMPNHGFVRVLLLHTRAPITGTSANVSGQPSCSAATEVVEQFQNRKHKPDYIVDAGKLPVSKPSRIVDITGSTHMVIRK